MKKRLLAIVLALLTLCTLLSVSILAEIIPGENEALPLPWQYKITLPTGDGYTVTATDNSVSPVPEGGNFSFTVAIADGYKKDTGFAVKANGATLTEVDGVYTINNITDNQVVTVEGVVEDVAKVKIGDIDNNGKINAKDITLLRAAVLNKTATTDCPVSGDIDNNGKVNAKDITLLRAAVLNKTTGELGER